MTRVSIFDRPTLAPEPPTDPWPERYIRALGPWVFLRIPADGDNVTEAGLVLPEVAMRGRHDRAIVLAAGPKTGIDRGDRVCFDPYKIRTIFGHGQLANAQGTPLARPGDTFVVHIDHVLFVEDPDDEPQD